MFNAQPQCLLGSSVNKTIQLVEMSADVIAIKIVRELVVFDKGGQLLFVGTYEEMPEPIRKHLSSLKAVEDPRILENVLKVISLENQNTRLKRALDDSTKTMHDIVLSSEEIHDALIQAINKPCKN